METTIWGVEILGETTFSGLKVNALGILQLRAGARQGYIGSRALGYRV